MLPQTCQELVQCRQFLTWGSFSHVILVSIKLTEANQHVDTVSICPLNSYLSNYRLVKLSDPTKEVSLCSEQGLLQKLITHESEKKF